MAAGWPVLLASGSFMSAFGGRSFPEASEASSAERSLQVMRRTSPLTKIDCLPSPLPLTSLRGSPLLPPMPALSAQSDTAGRLHSAHRHARPPPPE